MDYFTHAFDAHRGVMTIKLLKGFAQDHWQALINFYKEKINEGIKAWELNLTDLLMMTSASIGMVVALNTSVRAHSGTFRLILAKESAVTNQIRFAKLDTILDVEYV